MIDARRMFASGALLAAAAAWPNVLCLPSELTASPLERAIRTSWCGATPVATATHCAACWLGAGVLAMLAAAVAIGAPKLSRAR